MRAKSRVQLETSRRNIRKAQVSRIGIRGRKHRKRQGI